jgi:DNA-binding NtrC family response regulator
VKAAAQDSRSIIFVSGEVSNVVEDCKKKSQQSDAAAQPLLYRRPNIDKVSGRIAAHAFIRGMWHTGTALREMEREYILEVLRRTVGNKSRAAELLGLDRKTLYRRLDEYHADGASGV